MLVLFRSVISISLTCVPVILLLACLHRIPFRHLSRRFLAVLCLVTAVRLLIPFQHTAFLPVEIGKTTEYSGDRNAADQNALRFEKEETSHIGPAALQQDVSVNSSAVLGTLTGQGPLGTLISDFIHEADKDFWLHASLAVWLAGVVVWIVLGVAAYELTLHRLKTAVMDDDPWVLSWIRQNRGRKNVTVWRSDAVKAPMTAGVFRTRIFLPNTEAYRDRTSLEMILCHEMAHVNHYDLPGKLILLAMLALHWFNPLAWILYRMCNADFEYAADEAVIRKHGSSQKQNYARLLLAASIEAHSFLPVNPLREGGVSMRMKALADYDENRRPQRKILYIALVCLLAAAGAITFWHFRPLPESLKKATEYNRFLAAEITYTDPWDTDSLHLSPSYAAMKEQDADGIIGELSIPSIDVKLPIVYGAAQETLDSAIGHLEGSALPAGGPDTHSVLAGHRGAPDRKFLTDLHLMELGDTFTITVDGAALSYRVDQITVMHPADADSETESAFYSDEGEPIEALLAPVEGEDLVTLLTTTPYGVNEGRLLVRGHRINAL